MEFVVDISKNVNKNYFETALNTTKEYVRGVKDGRFGVFTWAQVDVEKKNSKFSSFLL